MAWRWLGLVLCCMVASGCADIPDWAKYQHSPAQEISEPTAPPVVRSQTTDVKLQSPVPGPTPADLRQPVSLPPMAAEKEAPPAVQASRGIPRLSIRAWVNGQPIFDSEIEFEAGPKLGDAVKLPEPERSERITELKKKELDNIIELELMYQDAMKRMSQGSSGKSSPIDKLDEFVNLEVMKTLKKVRDGGMPEAQIREFEPTYRRMMKRRMLAMEYLRTVIKSYENCVSPDDIREYYEEHKNEYEFQTLDRVEWQDIFIRVGPNLPTIEHVKRFAEDQINKCRTAADFDKLLVYNEGVNKHNGEGLGNLRGQIYPRELEDTVFSLREGEIGPVVPLGTGVHIIRITKRDYAGQKPFDYAVQKAIRKKLQDERLENERRRLVHDLKARAVIRIEEAGR